MVQTFLCIIFDSESMGTVFYKKENGIKFMKSIGEMHKVHEL